MRTADIRDTRPPAAPVPVNSSELKNSVPASRKAIKGIAKAPATDIPHRLHPKKKNAHRRRSPPMPGLPTNRVGDRASMAGEVRNRNGLRSSSGSAAAACDGFQMPQEQLSVVCKNVAAKSAAKQCFDVVDISGHTAPQTLTSVFAESTGRRRASDAFPFLSRLLSPRAGPVCSQEGSSFSSDSRRFPPFTSLLPLRRPCFPGRFVSLPTKNSAHRPHAESSGKPEACRGPHSDHTGNS